MKKLTIFLLLMSFFLRESEAQQQNNLEYIIQKGDNGNVVVLLHGYGSNENDLFSFANYFPRGTTIICLRGPITYSKTSFSWYDIAFSNDGNHKRNILQGNESTQQIESFIKSIKNKYSGSIVIGGFSQGAIMSVNLAIKSPEIIDGVISLSGALFEENLNPTESKKSTYKKLKVFYAHGTKDELLPLSHGRRCKSLLEAAEVSLTYKEYPIAHSISPQEIKDFLDWYSTNF